MKRKMNSGKRILSIFLTLLLLVSAVPINVIPTSAAETGNEVFGNIDIDPIIFIHGDSSDGDQYDYMKYGNTIADGTYSGEAQTLVSSKKTISSIIVEETNKTLSVNDSKLTGSLGDRYNSVRDNSDYATLKFVFNDGTFEYHRLAVRSNPVEMHIDYMTKHYASSWGIWYGFPTAWQILAIGSYGTNQGASYGNRTNGYGTERSGYNNYKAMYNCYNTVNDYWEDKGGTQKGDGWTENTLNDVDKVGGYYYLTATNKYNGSGATSVSSQLATYYIDISTNKNYGLSNNGSSYSLTLEQCSIYASDKCDQNYSGRQSQSMTVKSGNSTMNASDALSEISVKTETKGTITVSGAASPGTTKGALYLSYKSSQKGSRSTSYDKSYATCDMTTNIQLIVSDKTTQRNGYNTLVNEIKNLRQACFTEESWNNMREKVLALESWLNDNTDTDTNKGTNLLIAAQNARNALVHSSESNHNLVLISSTAATCTVQSTEIYECTYNCGFQKTTHDTPATGHSYQFTSWTWTDDFKATANFTCTRDGSHTTTATATVTSEVTTNSTCTAEGVRTYTATVTFENNTYTDTKTETLGAKGHTEADPVRENEVAATCETAGSYDEVVYCSVCNTEISRTPKTIPAHHTHTTENGVDKCSACDKYFFEADCTNEVIVPENQTMISDKGVIKFDITNAVGVVKTVADENAVSKDAFSTNKEVAGNSGTLTLSGDKATYTIASMQFSDVDVFYIVVALTKNNSTVYTYQQITIIPADRLYFEDTFEENGIAFTGNWVGVGSEALNDADNIEFDGDYATCATYSANGAKKVKVSADDKGNWPKAEFTFAGTGFDIISLTSNETGTFVLTITDSNENVVKKIIRDTYYGYTYDFSTEEWSVKPDAESAIYQVPVITVSDLEYGVYSVTLEARYSAMFDNAGKGNYDFYFDAVRIHNPGGSAVSDLYDSFSSYTLIKNKTLESGTILLDGNTQVPANKVADFTATSPEGELYIASGDSIAFELDTENTIDVLLGMRAADGKSVSVTISNGTITKTEIISTATELYYSISEMSGTVTITNTITNNGDGILSLTNLKVVTAEKPTDSEASDYMSVNAKTAPRAMAILKMLDSDLSINPEAIETATDDSGKITLTVKTSSDVANLIIYDADGNEITADEINSIANGDEITWTVKLTATESGTYTYSIQGAYENGYVSEDPVEITVKVELPETAPEVTPDDTDDTEDEEENKKLTLFELIIRIIKRIIYKVFGVSYD